MSRRIKYIGKAPHKRDNVCRTTLFWPHQGAIVDTPDEIAVRLLAHKDVWVEAVPGDTGAPMDASGGAPKTVEERVESAIKEIEACDGWFFVDLYRETGELPTQIQPATPDPDAGLGDPNPSPQVETRFPFNNDREAAVIQAINLLNRKDEDHFTKQGIPRVEAISQLLGYEITAEERTKAWEHIQEGEQ